VWPLGRMRDLLEQLRDIDALVKSKPYLEAEANQPLKESA
jgi:hypothetical protein